MLDTGYWMLRCWTLDKHYLRYSAFGRSLFGVIWGNNNIEQGTPNVE